MRDGFPDRPPRLDRIFGTPVFFVTLCTYKRQSILATPRLHAAFVQFCERARDEHNIAVGRYVIMPDHIHLFVCGDLKFELGKWIKSLKQTLGKALEIERERIWQEGFFDHVLRNDESMAQKWEYVRENPVRAGLVPKVEDWPYQGEVVVIDRVL